MNASSTHSGDQAIILIVRGLSKRFGSRLVFRGLNFNVPSGKIVAITGNNGAGKSTLLRIVAGLSRPADGEVLLPDTNDMRCGLFAPDAPVYRELTVGENVEFFARAITNAPASLDEHLERFQLSSRREQLAGDLSSGWRARLQLAVAALGEPLVLLLDEPSAHLDEAGIELLHDLLQAQRRRGIALVATNDAREAAHCDFSVEL